MIEFAVERLGLAQPDIESLLPAQWNHTGDKDIDCRPNWALYHQFADKTGGPKNDDVIWFHGRVGHK